MEQALWVQCEGCQDYLSNTSKESNRFNCGHYYCSPCLKRFIDENLAPDASRFLAEPLHPCRGKPGHPNIEGDAHIYSSVVGRIYGIDATKENQKYRVKGQVQCQKCRQSI